MAREQLREFLVQLSDVRLDHLEFIERQREQPPVDGMQIGAGAERVAQLIRRRAQPRTAERGDGRRIGFAARDGAQHAPRTGPEQIRHQTRQLDMRFLEQALQPVLELHPIAASIGTCGASPSATVAASRPAQSSA